MIVRFSSNYENLKFGRTPNNNNEIVISEGLANKLGSLESTLGRYLIISGEVEESLDQNERLIKRYNQNKLLVVGITNEKKNYVYQNQDWTITFFRDKLGVSSFLLIPNGIVFELDYSVDSEKLCESPAPKSQRMCGIY